jgi:hypothetical protein
VTTKVYRESYMEVWIGMKLATDAELMYSAFGITFSSGVPSDPTIQQTVTDNLLAICANELKACLPADWSIQEGFCLFGRWDGTGTPISPTKVPTTNAPEAGTRGPGGSAVQNTAVLVHKTVPYGRTGRMFLPGVSEAEVSPNGTLSPTELNLWQVKLNSMKNLIDIEISYPTNFCSMQTQFVPGDEFTITKPVNAFVVDGVVATQRRRLRR